ncbi:MAG: helix-turn-helix transcriptional regulator [Hyphomicrobiales bacterium]|nr:helix-turn-helix transcriptional regulator [Hyphomicrobiales bacterium]
MSNALAVCHGAFGRVTVYKLDRPMRTHAHREGHLTYLLSGPPAVVTICDVPHVVNETRGVAINPWQPHSFCPSPGNQGSVFLVAYLCERWLDRDQHGRGSLRFGANTIEVGTTIRSIAVSLAHVLVTHASCRIVERYLNQLFDASFDASWSKDRRPATLSACRTSIDFRVRKSLHLLQDGCSQGLELDAIARHVGLSRPHFFKLFRENTGVTPALYANTMRIERALERLMDPQISVSDIGFELGFSSQSHFTHFFSAHVGVAPNLYRTIARVVVE